MKHLIPIMVILLMVSTSFVGVSYNVENSSPASFNGNILFVGGSGPGNYSKIQDAIDNASGGDTVFVYNGTYYERIIINKSLNVIGEGRNITVICGLTHQYVIYLDTNGINIKGFKIQNGEYGGIELGYSKYNTIENNYITNNGCAIYVHNSNYNNITNNIIESNEWSGIFLDFSSKYNNISHNIILENTMMGIGIAGQSNYNTIFNNSFFNDGLIVGDSYDNNVINNKVNNKALVYFKDESDKIIDNGIGQVILINCNNITVKNQNLSNTEVGLHLIETNNCNIINNNFLNDNYGILFHYSRNNTIKNNNISFNYFIGSCFRYSNNNILRGSIILDNDYGISLESSNSNHIINNNISENSRWGINIERESDNNKIIDNIISNNDYCGIRFFESCNNNIIYHNKFLKNSKNAYDEYDNIWDNGYPSGGNFWDDYKGNDSDGDGIGNTPYSIPGGDNVDSYPLGNFPPDIPTIDGQNKGEAGKEYEYIFNSTDHEDNSVMYFIDWGDNYTEWTEYCNPGKKITLNHTWNNKGKYTIKVKAKDIYNAESEWAYLEVTMPYAYNPFWWLNGLLDRFPLLQRFLEGLFR